MLYRSAGALMHSQPSTIRYRRAAQHVINSSPRLRTRLSRFAAVWRCPYRGSTFGFQTDQIEKNFLRANGRDAHCWTPPARIQFEHPAPTLGV
jgi:hypothetical protein